MERTARSQTGLYGAARALLEGWIDRSRQAPESLVAYAIVLPVLVEHVLTGGELPAWRYYGAMMAIFALLLVNMLPDDPETPLPRGAPRFWAFLLLSTLLFLAALWLSDVPAFLPFVMFLLVGQSTWGLRLPHAIAYAVALATTFGAVLVLRFAATNVLEIVTNIAAGMLFTIVFTLLSVRYREQKERAEGLVDELRRATTELEAARAQEQELAVAKERVRLARDIHDGLGHHLTVLNVQLQAAEKLLARDPQRAGQAIATSREVAQAALDEVRHSVSALHRSPLDGRSLDVALADLVSEFGERVGLSAHFQLCGDPTPLAPPAAMTLYRAAQEGLTNTSKHAVASSVAAALVYEPGVVRLTMRDNGRASPEAPGSGGGFGLAALRERAEQLGGTFSAGAAADGGFQLMVEIPASDTDSR